MHTLKLKWFTRFLFCSPHCVHMHFNEKCKCRNEHKILSMHKIYDEFSPLSWILIGRHTQNYAFFMISRFFFCWLSSARPVDSATLLMFFMLFCFISTLRRRCRLRRWLSFTLSNGFSLTAKLSAFGDFVRLNQKLSNEKNIIRLLIEPAQHTKIEKSFEPNLMNWKGWLKSPLKIALNKGRVFFCVLARTEKKLLKAEKVDIHDDDLLELLLYSGRRSITKINPTEDDERGPIVSFLIPSTWFHSLLYFRKRIITMKRGKNLICNLLIKKWQENWFCVWPLRSPSLSLSFTFLLHHLIENVSYTPNVVFFWPLLGPEKKNEYNSDSEKSSFSPHDAPALLCCWPADGWKLKIFWENFLTWGLRCGNKNNSHFLWEFFSVFDNFRGDCGADLIIHCLTQTPIFPNDARSSHIKMDPRTRIDDFHDESEEKWWRNAGLFFWWRREERNKKTRDNRW